MDVRTFLKEHTLIFDGAMGSYLMTKYHRPADGCETTNLEAPEQVKAVHQAYLASGCNAIKTNTFGANRLTMGEETCRKVIEAGWNIAKEAAGDAFVFADLGPVPMTDAKRATLSSFSCIGEIARYIREKQPEAYIITSFASQPDGFTRSGQLATHLIHQAEANPAVDAVGLNCVSGARHMISLVEQLGTVEKPLSVMPNAGYPTVLGGRTIYEGDPQYFAGQMERLHAMGVGILGGCCGTTPKHLAATVEALGGGTPKEIPVVQPEQKKPQPERNRFWETLEQPGKKPIAVELDPPESGDVAKFMAGARELLACKIHRELGVEALPHMTCRDRNLNATKALLLGLSAEGVHNVLTVTGDPIPSADRDEVKSVFNFNSRMLARYITGLGETVLTTPFRVFGALNLNARNFSVQLRLAQKKEENGMMGFLTQPVLTAQALENLKLAHETLHGKILGGIIPVVSQRNALFMNSEVSGITVDQEIIDRYAGLDRAQGEELAVRISTTIAKEIAPYVDGFYLMTPFGRTGLMGRIMDEIRKENL